MAIVRDGYRFSAKCQDDWTGAADRGYGAEEIRAHAERTRVDRRQWWL